MPDEPAPAKPKPHAQLLQGALQAAELAAAQGPMSGPILHLRQRGDAARVDARWFLAALIVAVVFGLAFYLGQPFWKQWADGRRSTLTETIRATEQVLEGFDQEREKLQEELVIALTQAAERLFLRGPEGVDFRGGLVLDPDTVLLFGAGSTVIPWTRTGRLGPRLVLPGSESVYFNGGLKLDPDTVLLFGTEGTVIRWTRTGGPEPKLTLPGSENVNFLGGLALDADTALLFGAKGTVIRWTRSGGPEPKLTLPGSESVVFTGGLALDADTALIYGDEGTVIRWTRSGGPEPRLTLPGSETVVFTGGLALDADTALLFGDRATMIRWTRTGGPEPRLVLPGSENVYYTGGLKLEPDTALIFGSQGTVIRWIRTGGPEPRLVLPGSESVDFQGGLALDPDTALIYGNQGTVIRWTRSGGPEPRLVLSGWESVFFLGGLALDPDTVWLFGADGTVNNAYITGGMIRISNFHADQAAALVLKPPVMSGPGQTTGTAPGRVVAERGARQDLLTDFIDRLPPDVRALPGVQEVFAAAQGMVAQQRVLGQTIATTSRKLRELDQFPHSFLLLGKQREDFASFMTICRHEPTPDAEQTVAAGPTVAAEATEPAASTVAASLPTEQPPPDPPDLVMPDQMTLACLSGWNDQRQSETESWWQTLAAQVPPGILLLFLLSTLAALYRYNLRLAGFHHSRADALELMAMGTAKVNIEQLTSIAAVLAADKVVFGKDDTATRQAVELIKAFKPPVT